MWQRVKVILTEALELPAAEQARYIEQACAGDSALHQEVMELLAYQSKADSFLNVPVEAATNPNNQTSSPVVIDMERVQKMLIDLIGQVLDGKYQVEAQLAQGGMGAVYKATHLGTDRPVALKIILPQFMSNKEFIARFKKEAKAAGKLQHPNIINVTDFGIVSSGIDQIAYLVMEFLDGLSLGELLKTQAKLPLALVVDIVEQICLAIDVAHQRGIVHRDLKPDNIWLQPNGRGSYQVKVLDFGLAKFKDDHYKDDQFKDNKLAGESILNGIIPYYVTANQALLSDQHDNVKTAIHHYYAAGQVSSQLTLADDETDHLGRVTVGDLPANTIPEWLTRVGAIMGTPLYMSPEQCTGGELGAASDIYSVGIIAYQMLAGETPFNGELHQVIYNQRHRAAPPLSKQRDDIPNSVSTLIMSALAKNISERPATAKTFAKALRAKFEGEALVNKQARNIFQAHRTSLVHLSWKIYGPVAFFIGLFIPYAIPHLSGITRLASWGFLVLIMLMANKINMAAIALVFKQLNQQPDSKIKPEQTFKMLLNHWPALAATLIINHLAVLRQILRLKKTGLITYRDSLLIVPVVMMEGLTGRRAIARSKELVKQLPEQIIASQIYNLFIASFVVLLFQAAALLQNITKDIFRQDADGISQPTVAILIVFLIELALALLLPYLLPLAVAMVTCPKMALASMLNYATAVELSSPEQQPLVNNILVQEWKHAPAKSRFEFARFEFRRVVRLAAMLIVTLLSWNVIKNGLFVSELTANNKQLASTLITLGVEVDTRSFFSGGTLLMLALKADNDNLADILIEKGADINAKDAVGLTPLIYALQGKSGRVINLLKLGADKELKEKEGYRNRVIYTAVAAHNINNLEAVMSYGGNFRRDAGEALNLAASQGLSDIVQILVDKGIDINAQMATGEPGPALHNAVKQGNINTIKILLANGADPNIKDRYGKTAFDIAAERNEQDEYNEQNKKEVIELLNKTKVKL